MGHGWALVALALLAGCASAPPPVQEAPAPVIVPSAPARPAESAPVTGSGLMGTPGAASPQRAGRSRWIPVDWRELPGWGQDDLQDAWNAWIQNCARPGPLLAPLCSEMRPLSLADDAQRRAWMQQRFQPYRVETLEGQTEGLLTSYYEPLFEASSQRRPGFEVPLYAPPEGLELVRRQGRAWYTRQEIDQLPAAREALRGREIAWLADPIDALVLHIQGSGRLRLQDGAGGSRWVRVAFAGSNEQPYGSVGRWLLDRGLVRDASWPGIRAWMVAQQQLDPSRVQDMLWSNPRYIFFRLESLQGPDAALGPRGAQGVPLTPGRSVAVDKESIPYAAPLWLVSEGAQGRLQRLVFAQDTGSAITGAVRADYYAGTGPQAGEWAGRVKQPLRLWVLWPIGQ